MAAALYIGGGHSSASLFTAAGSLVGLSTATAKKLSAPRLYTANGLHTASTTYAARKGTREKARAKKVKTEITKVGFIPHNQRGKDRLRKVHVDKHLDDSYKQTSKDDVFPMRYYRWVVYSVEQAVDLHRETHHPTMYNVPDALVYAQVEMNMNAAKKNRYVENFSRISLIPHPFPRDEQRSILAFCKGQDLQKEALDAGAALAGGVELVKKIQEGELKLLDYDYVIAHPNILTDLVPIRGLMKRKFPSPKAGTLDPDLPALVKKFASGVQYRVAKDETQNNFATIQVPIGRLNMESKKVAENLEALLKDLNAGRPKREGLFITRCFIVSPPASEKLKVDPFAFIAPSVASRDQDDDSDDEADDKMAAAA